jgi:hypothetical protein
MMRKPRFADPEHGRHLVSLAIVVGIVIVTIGVMMLGRIRSLATAASATSRSISIEPRSARLVDRTYREGDVVTAHFSIINPLERPVTIKAIHTSCSCMATVTEQGPSPPFNMAPGGKVAFLVRGGVRSGPELEQSYSIQVESSCGDEPLPECFADVIFRAEDSVKAYPFDIKIAGVPTAEPIHRKIYLYKTTAWDGGQPPGLRVSNPESVRTSITAISENPPDFALKDFRVQFQIDVTIVPPRSLARISTTIDVLSENGQTLLTIPVECEYEREYRLSSDHVDVEGTAGSIIKREMFFESDSPAWRELAVTAVPDGVTAKVEVFDATTRVVRLTFRMPGANQGNDGEIVLRSRDGTRSIKIPFHLATTRG